MSGLFSGLEPIQPDALLQLMVMARADDRPQKIDAGVGVYKTSDGDTPVMSAVRKAEQRLHDAQSSKSYLGMRGDAGYAEEIGKLLFGPLWGGDRLVGLQTPGGCGALALGFALVRAARPQAKVWVGTPTWPNHEPLIKGAGLTIETYPYYDKASTSVQFDEMVAALERADEGDVVLLHGCCHNPTGADLDAGQWAKVRSIIAARKLVPFVDIAYQGLGDGLEEDAAGARSVVEAVDEAIIAQSCDKNFGMYRDRVGTLFVKGRDADATKLALDWIMQLARELWSMPPDHGAAVVRMVLEDDELREEWRAELDSMRDRINSLREMIAACDPRLEYIGRQKGMFSMLPVSPEQVVRLREEFAIYVAGSGRFNICGMGDDQVAYFCNSVKAVIDG
ncbi:amino acid aminotransferase [Sphingomicrobium aestuariivivum]|uniref:amino acid aminotransferase n=1 Tax=Sphingomicrobium aestuariivivum TaxID=1582356 RepID=UPI001FD7128A|nr:amino acid aminotransferase [Sphingomicrobium aestuariivivum]MCJ8190306.1 aspartate/tyrosine/aromatic aminotransferase [Sphingomicrobium aestuariivivum]